MCKERRIATVEGIRKPEQIEEAIKDGAQFLIWGSDLVFLRRQAKLGADALAKALT